MAVIYYNLGVGKNGGEHATKTKRTSRSRRPEADDPKSERVDVRLTKEELKKLDEYCKYKGVSRPQGLRDGLKVLKIK